MPWAPRLRRTRALLLQGCLVKRVVHGTTSVSAGTGVWVATPVHRLFSLARGPGRPIRPFSTGSRAPAATPPGADARFPQPPLWCAASSGARSSGWTTVGRRVLPPWPPGAEARRAPAGTDPRTRLGSAALRGGRMEVSSHHGTSRSLRTTEQSAALRIRQAAQAGLAPGRPRFCPDSSWHSGTGIAWTMTG